MPGTDYQFAFEAAKLPDGKTCDDVTAEITNPQPKQ